MHILVGFAALLFFIYSKRFRRFALWSIAVGAILSAVIVAANRRDAAPANVFDQFDSSADPAAQRSDELPIAAP